VRTQRKRPESRFDIAAELESRFMTPSQTEETFDTLGNPLAGVETTATTTSITTPQPELEVPAAATPERIAHQKAASRGDEDAVGRHLTNQLRTLAQEVKRVRAQAAKDRALGGAALDPANWTTREWRLVQRSVERWRRLKGFKLAEQLLTSAVLLREANIIA
jgi:kinesin family protein 1